MSERKREIPCSDCKEWKADLEMSGYRVIGCDQTTAAQGMCVLRYTDDKGVVGGMGAALIAVSANAIDAAPPGAAASPWKKRAEAIVNIFETGSVLGDYSQVTLIQHDSGHLTYGRSQTTLGSGNLHILIALYCERNGAVFARRLTPYLPLLKAKDVTLDDDIVLKNLLRAAADDPVMRTAQDDFFDQHYWQTAERKSLAQGVATPLGRAVVYDSVVHGSWELMRDRTNEGAGSIQDLGEAAWIEAYLTTRRAWMINHPRPDIPKTAYRMDALFSLVKQQAWNLDLPIVIRGREISDVSLAGMPAGCYDGPAPGSRDLKLQSPIQRGADVRLLQLAIGSQAIEIGADGIYGPATDKAVKSFQLQQGGAQTGAVDKKQVKELTQALS